MTNSDRGMMGTILPGLAAKPRGRVAFAGPSATAAATHGLVQPCSKVARYEPRAGARLSKAVFCRLARFAGCLPLMKVSSQ